MFPFESARTFEHRARPGPVSLPPSSVIPCPAPTGVHLEIGLLLGEFYRIFGTSVLAIGRPIAAPLAMRTGNRRLETLSDGDTIRLCEGPSSEHLRVAPEKRFGRNADAKAGLRLSGAHADWCVWATPLVSPASRPPGFKATSSGVRWH